jgi:hypothetical protein
VGIDIRFNTSDYPQAQVGEYVYPDTTIEYTTSPSSLTFFYVEIYEMVDGQSVYIDGSTLAVPPRLYASNIFLPTYSYQRRKQIFLSKNL